MTLSNSQKTPAANLADNPTIRTLLERRSIRGFTDEPVDDQTVALLEQAAQHAATSRYFHEWSAIRVTDHDEALAIADMAHQRYVAEAPLLYIFLADQRRNGPTIRR
ncbi:MAG: nitroreductase family protein [Bifidobacterium sp.]|nr:nitroreductase family protein [Bifidobacterium sp.]